MPDSPSPELIEFRILPEDNGHEVPVALLTQGLQGLQQLIFLSALSLENRAVRQRVRISTDIQQRYTLHCRPPEEGSFKVSGRVGDLRKGLVNTGDVRGVMKLVHDFSHATLAASNQDLLRLVPDSRIRVSMLDCLRGMSPSPGSGYAFEFRNCIGDPVRLDEVLAERIEKVLTVPEPRQRQRTITGELRGIFFAEHRLSLFYAPKGRTLECLYDESLEPMLFENRRDLIQVTGQVEDADDGNPRRIVEVSRIEDLDLSPFVVTEIVPGEALERPLRLEPILSDDQQLIRLENTELDIDVFAATRAELLHELRGQLEMLWREFVTEDDSALSAPAQALKRRWLGLLKSAAAHAQR
jgi:hypothetical protein